MSDRARERRHALEVLQRHGWNSTSFQILEPQFRYWFADDDALVAYVESGRSRLVAGGPVCEATRIGEIVRSFVDASRREGFRVRFFPVESRLLERSAELTSIAIGVQPWWDPRRWNEVLSSRRRLREQLRRSRAKGVIVERVAGTGLERGSVIRREMELVIREWTETRSMAPMAFLVDVEPFEFAECRRYFVARQRGRVVALAAVVPVYARNGWFLEDLIRAPDAPNGTVELLIDAAMRDAAESGGSYFTLGIAPLADVEGALASIRSITRSLYNFDGVLRFKRKLGPTGEDRVDLAFPVEDSVVSAVIDLLRAFARNGFVSFGVDTVFRAPALVLRILATLLLVWSAVLALPAASGYFPSGSVRAAWIVFDLLLVVALFRLAGRWRQRLATGVLVAIAGDVALSVAQFVTHNVQRSWSWWEWSIMIIALLAPLFAFGVVTGGMQRYARLHAVNHGSDDR